MKRNLDDPAVPQPKKKKTQYAFSWKSTLKNKGPLYEVAFCPYGKHTDLFATAGGNRVSIFRLKQEGDMEPVAFIEDEAWDEEFFALGWATWDKQLFLVMGGNLGLIKTYNLENTECINAIEGHGDQINEISVHPRLHHIVATASKDMSARIWDVKNNRCLIVCNRHVSNVLTVSWNLTGTLMVTGSMDNSVSVWDMKRLEEIIEMKRKRHQPKFFTTPKYVTKWLHRNYVDSATFLGDWILSKSCENYIVLWKPHFDEPSRPPRKMHRFTYENGSLWFLRFCLDVRGRFLAVGNMCGDIFVWNLHDKRFDPMKLSGPNCNTAVRRVAFNRESTSCVAVCDDGTCWRWDRIDK